MRPEKGKVNSRIMKVLTGTEKRESSRCATLLLGDDTTLELLARSATRVLLELELAAGA